MRKIKATIIKEWILLKRDIAGLMLLLVMPAILIVVMAMVQDAPFRDYQELRFDLLLADNDKGSLADEIKTGLRSSKNFHVIDSIDGKPITDEKLKELIQSGEYKVGIIIPKGATAEVVNSSNIIVNDISKKLGMGANLPSREMRDSNYVRMYFDPVTKPTFRTSISFALEQYVTYSCSNLLVERLSAMSKMEGDTTEPADFAEIFKGIGVKTASLNDEHGGYEAHVNSVQHNVPAWAIFGMFFIVVPIAGNMIREREEGSALRVELVPRARRLVGLGKILFYTLICMLQFLCMLAIGFWVLPLLGLPALYAGAHPWLLAPVIILIAYTATSYGYFVGAVFKTSNQAMPFGAISIVILSALGGIWVPVDLLPPVMQKLAMMSPLHWGLDAVHQIILRDSTINGIWLHMLLMLVFGTLLWVISVYGGNIRKHSVQ